MTPARIYHATLRWEDNGHIYKKELILCAADKATAEDMARSRIPFSFSTQTDTAPVRHTNIRIRDYGLPQNRKIIYASDIQPTERMDDNTPSAVENRMMDLACAWGAMERALIDSKTEAHLAFYTKMQHTEKKEQLWLSWARELTEIGRTDIRKFLQDKLTDLYGISVPDLSAAKNPQHMDIPSDTAQKTEQLLMRAKETVEKLEETAKQHSEETIKKADQMLTTMERLYQQIQERLPEVQTEQETENTVSTTTEPENEETQIKQQATVDTPTIEAMIAQAKQSSLSVDGNQLNAYTCYQNMRAQKSEEPEEEQLYRILLSAKTKDGTNAWEDLCKTTQNTPPDHADDPTEDEIFT